MLPHFYLLHHTGTKIKSNSKSVCMQKEMYSVHMVYSHVEPIKSTLYIERTFNLSLFLWVRIFSILFIGSVKLCSHLLLFMMIRKFWRIFCISMRTRLHFRCYLFLHLLSFLVSILMCTIFGVYIFDWARENFYLGIIWCVVFTVVSIDNVSIVFHVYILFNVYAVGYCVMVAQLKPILYVCVFSKNRIIEHSLI